MQQRAREMNPHKKNYIYNFFIFYTYIYIVHEYYSLILINFLYDRNPFLACYFDVDGWNFCSLLFLVIIFFFIFCPYFLFAFLIFFEESWRKNNRVQFLSMLLLAVHFVFLDLKRVYLYPRIISSSKGTKQFAWICLFFIPFFL